MASYGNYGGGYDQARREGFGRRGGRNAGGQPKRRGGGPQSGQTNFWQDGRMRGRKRRFEYDQLLQFEQRNDFWRSQPEYYDYDEGWYGGNNYSDGYYNEEYQGSSQWGGQGYYDGGYGIQKRGRYRSGPPGKRRNSHRRNGSTQKRKDPNSFSFYDEHPSDSYDKYEETWPEDVPMGSRRRENLASGQRKRRDHPEFRSRSSGQPRSFSGPTRKKSAAEEAIYEKHKLLTVDKEKRTHIGNTVHILLSALREVAKHLANPPTEEEDSNKKEALQVELENNEESTSNTSSTKSDACDDKPAVAAQVATNEKSDLSTVLDGGNLVASKEETGTAANSNKEDKQTAADHTIAEEKDQENTKKVDSGEKKQKTKPSSVLFGSVRCGESAMRILIGDTLQETIVVLCKKKPTHSLLEKVKDLLESRVTASAKMKDKKFTLQINDEKEQIIMKQESIEGFKVVFRLTSPAWSEDTSNIPAFFTEETGEEQVDGPEDLLSMVNCKESLVLIRQMRFFIKKLDSSPVSLTVLRTLLYLRSTPGFNKLSIWQTFVIVSLARASVDEENKASEKTSTEIYRVDTVLTRCLEILSSGILLPASYGIKDPCVEGVDTSACLSAQDAEDITVAAQHALRMIKFGQIREMLGLEKKS